MPGLAMLRCNILMVNKDIDGCKELRFDIIDELKK